MSITLTTAGCGLFGGSQSPDELRPSIAIPDQGIGKQWMTPDQYINYEGLAILTKPTADAPQQYGGVGMFGKCVFVIGKVPGTEVYESALVLNDGTKSIAQETGATLPNTKRFLASNRLACQP